ncbi:sensor histidine kinase [Steroidobacter flavus]|uniref:histidine kinase n=1 Tax=Steroidobacter flavus TaxID=1842136 RepID=A0ABV8T504_9GAMM
MRLRLPLYGKFLIWLVANILLVIGAVFLGFADRHTFGWNIMLTHGTRERLQGLAGNLAGDVGPLIARELKIDLQRYDAERGLRFGIYLGDGRRVAGAEHPLPTEVSDELRRTDVLMLAAIPGPLRNNLDALANGALTPLVLPAWPPLDAGELRRQQFVLHAAERWWVGIRAPMPNQEGALVPVTILLDTTSLPRLALFLGVTPWLTIAAVLVLASILFWLPLLWSLSHAMTKILRAVERIADGHFEARSGIARGDELGRVAQAVDTVGGRLENFVNSQRHFLADIAHEVRSPLGRMQLGLGILEQHLPPSAAQTFSEVYEEAQVMTELINELLAFSRAGVGDSRLPALSMSLKGLVLEAVQREDARERVLVTVPESLQVRVNTSLLVRAVGNLIRNALRYAGTDAGPIEVIAHPVDMMIALRVMDRGPGVPELALLKLGDPFYRPEVARSRSSGGIGLGLATVRNCVSACRGKVIFRNREGGGFEAEIQLPMPEA